MKKYSLILCIAGLSIFSASCSLQNECDTTELRCTIDKTTNNAQLETCSNGYWAVSKTCETNQCNESQTDCEAAACTPGEKTCDGDGFKVCNTNGKWGESDKSCQYGCFDNESCKECDGSTMRCQGSHYQQCIFGKWTGENNAIECPNHAKCLADGSGCEECAEGDSKCDESGVITCQNGAWSAPEKCYECTPDGKQCGECKTSDKRCQDGKEQICMSAQFVDYRSCDLGCSADGTKCLECTNDEKRCAGTNSYQSCKGGIWSEITICSEETPNCSGGECITESRCADGDIFCADNQLSKCKDGKWDPEPCPKGCAKDNKSCAECTQTECTDSTLTTCTDGKATIHQCTDSQGNKVSCDSTGTSCGGCLNGTKKCQESKLFTCENGGWSQTASCANGASCKANGIECGVCSDTQTRCQDKTLETCVNGEWNLPILCKNGCDAEGIKCAEDECSSTLIPNKCENGTQYTCSNGRWGQPKSCLYGCDGFKCADAECSSLTPYKCENKTQYTCVNGVWSQPKSCTYGCDGVKCAEAECSSLNPYKCENKTQYTCLNGVWSKPIICKNGCDINGKNCRDTPTLIMCSDGDKRCINDAETKRGQFSECQNQIWQPATQCPSMVSCNLTACGVCLNGTFCQNVKTITQTCRECINGEWGNETDCPSQSATELINICPRTTN